MNNLDFLVTVEPCNLSLKRFFINGFNSNKS